MTEFPRSLLSLGEEDDLDVIAEISATLDALNPKQPDDDTPTIYERGQKEQGAYLATQRVIQDTEQQAKLLAQAAQLDARGVLAQLGDEDVATQIIGAEAYQSLQNMADYQEEHRKLD